jgi:hypothetical protein
LKERTTPDSRNTPSTTDLEEEETVDAPGNDGNASMPKQVERHNPWMMMMMMMMKLCSKVSNVSASYPVVNTNDFTSKHSYIYKPHNITFITIIQYTGTYPTV